MPSPASRAIRTRSGAAKRTVENAAAIRGVGSGSSAKALIRGRARRSGSPPRRSARGPTAPAPRARRRRRAAARSSRPPAGPRRAGRATAPARDPSGRLQTIASRFPTASVTPIDTVGERHRRRLGARLRVGVERGARARPAPGSTARSRRGHAGPRRRRSVTSRRSPRGTARRPCPRRRARSRGVDAERGHEHAVARPRRCPRDRRARAAPLPSNPPARREPQDAAVHPVGDEDVAVRRHVEAARAGLAALLPVPSMPISPRPEPAGSRTATPSGRARRSQSNRASVRVGSPAVVRTRIGADGAARRVRDLGARRACAGRTGS